MKHIRVSSSLEQINGARPFHSFRDRTHSNFGGLVHGLRRLSAHIRYDQNRGARRLQDGDKSESNR